MMRFFWGIIGVVIWAIQLIGRLIRALLFAILFGAVLGGAIWFGSDFFGNWLGFAKNGVAHLILHTFAGIMGVSSAWAMLRDKFRDSTNPILTSHGSARFASPAERAVLTAHQGGLLIGRDLQSGKFMRYDGPGHLLTIAPTRTGKGVGTVIPNLLMADRSVICVDPKGENTAITAHARVRFGPVHVLDPFGITGQPSSCFNPLAALDPASVDLAEDAATLAEALVFDAPGEAGEAHWNEEAKALIGGLILYLVCHESVPGRTLANLRGLLTMSPPDFANLLTMMQGSTGAGGLVARAANRHLGKADREATGVLSAAQRHTHFLDSPRMTAALDHSDFDFGDLKRRTATVFFVLPPDRLATYARWLRLMVIQSLQDLARAPGQPVAPVLYLLDEFAALGHLAPVERAMSLMAGYGVQLWPILQDLHQLRSAYGRNAGTFFSNASVLQVFGVNDSETAQLVSGLLGQTTIVFSTEIADVQPDNIKPAIGKDWANFLGPLKSSASGIIGPVIEAKWPIDWRGSSEGAARPMEVVLPEGERMPQSNLQWARDAETARVAARAAAWQGKREDAFYACQTFIKRNLRDPDSADFMSSYGEGLVTKSGESGYNVMQEVRANNGFGGKTVSIFACETHLSGDNWELDNVQEKN